MHATKRPRAEMVGWQRLCDALPLEEDCKRWDLLYPNGNWGLALGRCSGLCVVDIDDADFIHIAPDSPVIRGGKPGRQQRFFRWSEEIRSQKLKRPGADAAAIEILSQGNYTVLPPSIHPDTEQPFFWISDVHLETLDIEKLPYLTEEMIQRMRNVICTDAYISKAEELGVKEIFTNNDSSRDSPHGAQDRLKFIAAKIIHRSPTLSQGVNELLDYDYQHHKPVGYFAERGRTSDQSADAYSNAARFYCNHLTFINRERMHKGELPYVPKVPVVEEPKEITTETLNYQPPEGVMKTFIDYCNMTAATTATTQLGLGGALALMSVLAANRVWAKADQFIITPNLYVLNLAPSGAGKEAPQKFITDLLYGQKLLGASTYRSGTALLQNLPSQQNRIDIIDEASGFLKAMGDKNNYQSEMAEILCHLFTKAPTEFGGIMAATKGKEPVGAVFQPHVTLLLSTTPSAFRSAANKELAVKGLFPRFLTFYERRKGNINRSYEEAKAEELKSVVSQFIGNFMYRYPLNQIAGQTNLLAPQKSATMQDISKGVRYAPAIFEFSKEALDVWKAFQESVFNETKTENEEFNEAFKNRFAELAAKCALLHALSAERGSVEVEDVRFGINVVEIQWANCEDVYELARAESSAHENAVFIKNILKRHGGSLDKAKLTQLTHRIGKRFREEALSELIDSDEIVEEIVKPGTNQAKKMFVLRSVERLKNSNFNTSTLS